jgi:hypothetical protein
MTLAKQVAGAVSLIGIVLTNPTFTRAADAPRLTMQALGKVMVGMTVPQAEKALGARLKPIDRADGISTEACWLTQNADGTRPSITYMIQKGEIVRIDVWDKPNTTDSASTDKGIRIGSSQRAVLDAYPNAEAAPHPHMDLNGRYIRVLADDKNYGLLFETASGKVVNFRAGKREAIELGETCL